MTAMQYGIARGLFSNESGMGSAPIAAAAAQTRNPVRQALVSSTGTFWDTVVVCALTGMVLVTSIMKNPSIDMSSISDGGVLTSLAFAQIPYIGPVILVLGIISFAFSTILGWAYYGERCVEYFAGKKGFCIPLSVHICAGRRAGDCPESCVDDCGYPERADGDPQPDCRSAALGSCGPGDRKIS